MDTRAKAVGGTGVVAILYVLFTWWLQVTDRADDPGMMGDVARFLADPPSGVVIFVLFFGLWCLWVYEYHKIEVIENKFRNRRKTANQRFADDLQNLHSEAVGLLAGPDDLISTADKDAWRDKIESWKQRVVKRMEEHGCAIQDVKHVEELSPLNNPTGRYQSHDDINVEFIWHAERMRRLKDVINKYMEHPLIPNKYDCQDGVQ